MPMTDPKGKPFTMTAVRRQLKKMKESNPAFAASFKKYNKQQQEGVLQIVLAGVNLFDSYEDFKNAVDGLAQRQQLQAETTSNETS